MRITATLRWRRFSRENRSITANDSGGTLEFAEDGVSGIVCEPRAEAIASAINDLAANRGRAASLGAVGFERAQQVTWDGVIEQLVGD